MINTTRLRCMLGWLGLLLPWIVVLLYFAFPESISATYYLPKTITPFMVILGSSSFLLISYRGYDSVDDWVNTISGTCGLGVCLFPCWVYDLAGQKVGTFNLPIETSNIFHVTSAIIFFSLLAINSLFLFTKSEHPRTPDPLLPPVRRVLNYIYQLFTTPAETTPNKKKRNVIFRICGAGMILSFAILLLPYFRIQTWLTEAIALFFFGISFLTKANCYPWLFCDTKNK